MTNLDLDGADLDAANLTYIAEHYNEVNAREIKRVCVSAAARIEELEQCYAVWMQKKMGWQERATNAEATVARLTQELDAARQYSWRDRADIAEKAHDASIRENMKLRDLCARAICMLRADYAEIMIKELDAL